MSMKKKVVWLPYDFDTAIGINNDGLLVFDYQLEDIDYQPGGEPVYNGQDSVIWKNIRAAFSEELAAMYRNLRSSGDLSYETVEQAFEEHQSKWAEAIFNEDSQFKYIDPFVNDNANYLYMLLGAKTEQRKWWLYNRFRYIDSKYIAGDARSDTIFIRPYAAADITITPYADIYATIAWDATITQERAARNEDVTLHCPYQTMSGNIVTVYSCSQLADIGDLSDLKVGQIDISKATRLQSLKVGSDGQYENLNLYSMTFGSNVLLKVIDARNCSGFGDTTIQGHSQTTVDISGCSIIEEIYFEGTKIQGITLPNGGNIKKLHLPGTITNLTVMNHQAIADFSIPSYANITTLRLENTSLDSRTILESVPANTRVRIIGFTWEADNAADIEGILDLLDTMRGLDEHGDNMEKAQVSGTIHTDSLTGTEIASFNARYPYINFTADHITALLTYKTFDGSANIGEPEVIYDGGNGTRVNSTTRQSTPQYNFTPDGWSLTPDGNKDENALVGVTADRTVYAAYRKDLRYYTATFVTAAIDGGETLYTQQNIPYGTTPVYSGTTPTTAQGTSEEWQFTGWNPALSGITKDTTYTAVFTDKRSPVLQYLSGNLKSYESDSIDAIGDHAFQNYTALESVRCSAKIIGANAFENCGNLEVVDLTSAEAVTLGNYSFYTNSKLKHLIIRSEYVASIAVDTMNTNTPIQTYNGAIYVPATMVNSYKQNTGMRHNVIVPIDQYPLTKFESIADSWSEILTNENYATDYMLGDTKRFTIDENEHIAMIVAFNEGNSKITWLTVDPIGTYRMNDTNDNTGGWAECEFRGVLQNDILPLVQSDIRNHIVAVDKTYYDYGTKSTLTVSDTLWIPSVREIKGVNAFSNNESSGMTYYDWLNPNGLRFLKGNMPTRTAHTNSSNYTTVGIGSSIGGSASTAALNQYIGFCTA